jgi:peptidyl-prolyl cis-trans isomerase C
MPAAAATVVQEATPGPVPAQLPEVVARVNGEPITRAELEMAVGQLEARAGQSVPPEQRDGVFRGVLDELIGFRLLKQESVARAVVVPASAVEARIDEIRSQFPSEAMFIQTIESRGTTLDSLREQAREGMEIDAMLQAVLTATAVTPDQVTAFYNENPAEFQQGERVRASHILIGFPEGASPDIKQQALAKAAELLDEVKAGGDFAALARQHSSDQGSAAAGGDLGYFERGQMVGPFEQAAFALLPAQTSELVESPFGYHIIRVVDRQASRTIPIADVRPQIQQFLEGRDRAQQTEAFVETLKAKGKVEILI